MGRSSSAVLPLAASTHDTSGSGGGSLGSSGGISVACGGANRADGAALSHEPWNLFAFPAESNFSGARYDPALGAAAATLQLPPGSRGGGTRGRWAVLLDAAKACGSCPPDLAAHPHVDFVVRSGHLAPKISGFTPLYRP